MGICTDKLLFRNSKLKTMCAMSEHEITLARKYTPEYRLRKKEEIENPEKLTPEEKEVESKLVPEMEKYRPCFSDFNYSKKVIEEDKKALAQKKEREGKKHRRPKILEAILFSEIEQANWFGENCYTVVASEFDDQFRGTDLVLEFEKEDGKVVRLALDITMSDEKKDIQEKKARIIENIEDAKLTRLKYFQSEADPRVKGEISNVPRVLIGTDTKGIQELSKIILQSLEKEKGSHRRLAQNEIQLELLEEVKLQLQELTRYATLYFQRNPHTPRYQEVIARHKEVLEIVNGIYEEKKKKLSGRQPKARKIFRLITDWSKERIALEAA